LTSLGREFGKTFPTLRCLRSAVFHKGKMAGALPNGNGDNILLKVKNINK